MRVNEAAPENPPKPKRPRRMVAWLVVVPAVILLLALAGANWKRFHLAYAKHLMNSDDPDKRQRGIEMVQETHLRKGMTLEEVRRLLAPTQTVEAQHLSRGRPLPTFRYYAVDVEGRYLLLLIFDENGRLYSTDFMGVLPLPGK